MLLFVGLCNLLRGGWGLRFWGLCFYVCLGWWVWGVRVLFCFFYLVVFFVVVGGFLEEEFWMWRRS